MPVDVDTPQSPGWWLMRLNTKLANRRRERIDALYARYAGEQGMPEVLRSAPDAAQTFFKASRTQFAEMLVKYLTYRMKVACIKTAHDSGEIGDAEAFAAWRRAGMLVEGVEAVRNMLVAGDGYVMVGVYEGAVAATSEDPRQVVTIHDPVRQSKVRAGAKFFHDSDFDVDLAYLHLEGRVYVARRPRKGSASLAVRFSSAWEWDESKGGAEGLPTNGVIVRVRNDEAVGEFERHVPLLDRIDHMILQGMVIATMQAFKQRAIKVDPADMPDVDPDTGEDIDYNDVFVSDPGALWKLPATAEMWESGAVDLTPIATMQTRELERLSAVTFTPLSAFTPEGANQSAQGASLVRENGTFKVEDRMARVGEAFAQVAAAIFSLSGGPLADLADPSMITIGWAPAERYGISEATQAAVNAKAAGVPWRTIMMRYLQFAPDEVATMATERANDLLLFPAEATVVRQAQGSQAAGSAAG